MATHSSILTWRIPRTKEPGRLWSMGSQESDRTERLSHYHRAKRSLRRYVGLERDLWVEASTMSWAGLSFSDSQDMGGDPKSWEAFGKELCSRITRMADGKKPC